MPSTYIKLASNTIGSAGAASVSFNGIPQTGYTDLKIVCSARGTRVSSGDLVALKFNSLTTNLSLRFIEGTGGGVPPAYTDTNVYGSIDAASSTTSAFGNAEFYIFNYTSANYKAINIQAATEQNGSTAYWDLGAGLWSSTAAISSLICYSPYGTNFVEFSTFTLYGIKNS